MDRIQMDLMGNYVGHKFGFFLAVLVAACIIIVSGPFSTSDPSASPDDKAKEDLGRFEYPSLADIKWRPHFIMPHESLERLFGDRWIDMARFNRIDRRHVYPGMTIKVPETVETIKFYNPLPLRYEPAEKYPKYILVDVGEQWLAGKTCSQ